MPARLGLNVVGLLTAEITTASTLKTMSTLKEKPTWRTSYHPFVHRNYEPVHYPLGDMAAGTLAVIFYRHRRGPPFARSQNDSSPTWFSLGQINA
jgi:hypothetical protein